MACNCNNLMSNFYFVNTAIVSGGNLVLTLNTNPSLVDKSKVCFRFKNGTAIPTGASTLPVVIDINGTNYPVYNKYGNIMLGSDLITTNNGAFYCPRFVYKSFIGLVGTDYHFIVHNIPRSSIVIYCD